jgi:exodeoxyribonuclease V beta subunit
VAATRARHTLWVGVAGLQVGRSKDYTWHRSALGYLLSGPTAQQPGQRLEDVEALRVRCPQLSVEMVPLAEGLPQPDVTLVRPREDLPPLTSPPVFSAQFDRHWAISSYSALVRDAAWGAAGSGQVPARAVREDEPPEVQAAAAAQRLPAHQPWHRFPRGAFAGNFLHDMLEWLAPERFALDESPALQQGLVRRCERQGWGHRSDDVVAWLRQVCTTPLQALGVPLAGLASTTPEMEFWFPSDGMHAGQVDLLCRQHLLPHRPRPELPERSLKGLLMGFADLVFEHEGRYWVLDYKSNALGSQDADYTDQAMEGAMLEHRYDVQAALYMLALHRLLKARLGATYIPAQHLGGALYLFLRGVHSPGAGCFHLAPPLGLLTALDAMLLQNTQSTHGEAA